MEDIQLRVTIEIFKVLLIDSNNLWKGSLDHVIDRAIEIGRDFSEKYIAIEVGRAFSEKSRDSIRNHYPSETTSSASF